MTMDESQKVVSDLRDTETIQNQLSIWSQEYVTIGSKPQLKENDHEYQAPIFESQKGKSDQREYSTSQAISAAASPFSRDHPVINETIMFPDLVSGPPDGRPL
jgi:hypothetical protein